MRAAAEEGGNVVVHPGLVATLLVVGVLVMHVTVTRSLQAARYERELQKVRSATWAHARLAQHQASQDDRSRRAA